MKPSPIFLSGVIAFVAFAAWSAAMSGAQARPTYVSFDPPDAVHGYASGTQAVVVNNKGQVAGQFNSQFQSRLEGFVRNPDGLIIEFVPRGASNTYVARMNNRGDVVGYYATSNGTELHGFIRSADGTLTTIDAPGSGNSTIVTDINESGTTVGSSDSPDYSGFIRTSDGKFAAIAPPGATWSAACGINNSGQVAGTFDQAGRHYLIRETDGSFTTFDLPFYADLLNGCLDAAGDIAGWNADTQGLPGFERKVDGEVIALDPPPASDGSHVESFSQRGVAVGSYVGSHGNEGFLDKPDGTVKTIKPPPRWKSISAFGVSSDGEYVVGIHYDAHEGYHGFLRVK